jgi:hypothetical protein
MLFVEEGIDELTGFVEYTDFDNSSLPDLD